jgi:hypothetical protein
MDTAPEKGKEETWWFSRMGTWWLVAELLMVMYTFRVLETRMAKTCDAEIVLWGWRIAANPAYAMRWDMVAWWIFHSARTVCALADYNGRVRTTDGWAMLTMFSDEPRYRYLKLRFYVLLVTTLQYVAMVSPHVLGGCVYTVPCVRGCLMLILYYTEFSTRKTPTHVER